MITSTELGAKLVGILRNIKTVGENSVLEFKAEPHSKKHDCELIKDILGLANAHERPAEDRWLIYGVNIKDHVLVGLDDKHPDLLDDANYQQKLSKISPDVHVEFISIPATSVAEDFNPDKIFAAFYIPCNCMSCIHECGETITDKEPDGRGRIRSLQPGTSFIRRGSSTKPLLEADREKLRALASAKVEQPHQFKTPSFAEGRYTKGTDVLLLLGSWDEANDNDKGLINELCGTPYFSVVKEIQPMLDDGTFKMNNSCWMIQDKMGAIARVGQHLTKAALLDLANPIGKIIFSVDESYRLPADDRDFADLKKVNRGASGVIRNGAASFCAVIGSHPEFIPQCKPEDIDQFLFSVLKVGSESADWRVFASADHDISLLAEASPSIFLSFVESSMKGDALKRLLQEKSGGMVSFGLGSGLIYGIRISALSGDALSRVIPILVDISRYTDIGDSAMVDLLLPWYPSTPASVECRMGASRFLARCSEEAAWKTLVALLPGNTTSSIGVVEPEYMVHPDLPESVSSEEYWDLSREYCVQALFAASGNMDRIEKVIANISSFKRAGMIDEVCAFLKEECQPLVSGDRCRIWINLLSYIDRCKKFSEADWAPKGEDLQKLEELANAIVPEGDLYNALRYCSVNDWDIIDGGDSADEGMKRVRSLRASALKNLYKEKGLSAVDELLDAGARGNAVGSAMALLPISKDDQLKVIAFLDDENLGSEKMKFARTYIGAMFMDNGHTWLGSLPISSWETARKAKFFSCLPIKREVWEQAEDALGSDSLQFWENAPDFFTLNNAEEVSYSVRRLIDVGRANVAIDALSMALQQEIVVEPQLIREALWGIQASQMDTMLAYHIEHLIEHLESVEPNDELFALELQYVAVLPERSNSYMHRCMAYDPRSFLTIVSLAFDLGLEDEGELQLSADARARIMFHALQGWKIAPGTNEDGEFSEEIFEAWTDTVDASTENTRARIILQRQAGRACFYAPSSDELFMPKVVAEYLESGGEALRGFEVECFNSRGVHWVDETGAAEDAIADKYEKKAKSAEAHGYLRLASSLRKTAKTYRREAENNRRGQW